MAVFPQLTLKIYLLNIFLFSYFLTLTPPYFLTLTKHELTPLIGKQLPFLCDWQLLFMVIFDCSHPILSRLVFPREYI